MAPEDPVEGGHPAVSAPAGPANPVERPSRPDGTDTLPRAAPPPPVPAVESRWVPLIPGAQSIPTGVSTRSGAFLMAATRAENAPQLVRGLAQLDLDLRSALISCLEAIVPTLEPGWSQCREHPSCRAVQEASRVLWGKPSSPPVEPSVSEVVGAVTPVPPAIPGGASEVKKDEPRSGTGP